LILGRVRLEAERSRVDAAGRHRFEMHRGQFRFLFRAAFISVRPLALAVAAKLLGVIVVAVAPAARQRRGCCRGGRIDAGKGGEDTAAIDVHDGDSGDSGTRSIKSRASRLSRTGTTAVSAKTVNAAPQPPARSGSPRRSA